VTIQPDASDRPSTLGRSLRALRERAGLSQVELAAATALSQSQISRGESGRRLLSPDQVARYVDTCLSRVNRDELPADLSRERLIALAGELEREHIDARAILQRGAHSFQERIRRYEEDSALVRAYQPGMVLGQLQSPAYARAVFAARGARDDAEIARLVDQRMSRNAQLRDPVRRWELIQTYGSLTWCLGSPAVMAGQMDHLIAASRLPNVDLGVIPAFRAADFTAQHGFHLYDADVVQVGTKNATALLSDRDDIVTYAELFSRLSALAVRGDEAREILSQLAREYRARE
jgi:transcriptional regulator with XRE-family HTH domain